MSADRTIGGLTPRAGEQDLSRLQRRNRPADTGGTGREPDVTPPASQEPAPPAPAATSRPARPAVSKAGEADKIKATVYLDPAIRERARAAYRATGHLEEERSWSEFVESAIAREVARRETTYNNGEPYARDTTRLAPGRPLD